jgi:hypothetical protein
MNKISFTAATAPRRCLLLAVSIGTLALSSCASSNSPASSAPQTSGNTEAVSSIHTYERAGRIMVAGHARPAFDNPGSHVDIKLVGADGRVVAQKVERIDLGHPRGSRARLGGDSFVASFPVDVFQQAASVRVTFHGGTHSNCAEAQG